MLCGGCVRMEMVSYYIAFLQEYIWSFPMLFLLLGTHLYFTFGSGVIQRKIPLGIKLSITGERQGFTALATALAATIGTGNIVGISTAIALGGPGAVFWCWLTGFLGIATCYGECFLAVNYRVKRKNGTYLGGPMYVLERVLGKKGMAVAFSVFTICASFGIGSSVQAHSICIAIKEQIPLPAQGIGLVTVLLAGLVIMGGRNQIAKVCTWLVPAMSTFYFGGCLLLLGLNYRWLGMAVKVIFASALTLPAVGGGLTGSAFMIAMRIGISRGLFTNEAGLGSIPMTAAVSETKSPVRQGLVSMTGPFWDTVVMCAVTGIASVSSMLSHEEAYLNVPPDRLCFVAFRQLPFAGEQILSVSLVLFAFATIIGWNVYGECAAEYLLGERGRRLYRIGYLLFVYLGAVVSLDLVWGLSDLFNSFMAIPNLYCLWKLRDEICTSARKPYREKIF